MPLHLAVLAPDRAAEVLDYYPGVKHWAIGGHSLGGSMAAHFAHGHPGAVQGLVLWASYPAGSDDLSAADLQVASIYGTQDGLVTVGKLEASRALLPPGTVWTAIEGGNHGQFGWYGPQAGDNPATISHGEQEAQTVAATVALLQLIQP
jgi:pimeloyl-ACP methyl ester carboxylesterase